MYATVSHTEDNNSKTIKQNITIKNYTKRRGVLMFKSFSFLKGFYGFCKENWITGINVTVLLFVIVFQPIVVHASTGSGTEFTSLYTLLTGWVQGIPGIIAAIGLMVAGLYLSFVGGKSPMYFFLTALGAAAIFLIPTIATSLGGAVW